jgi:hypothetical protein
MEKQKNKHYRPYIFHKPLVTLARMLAKLSLRFNFVYEEFVEHYRFELVKQCKQTRQ